MSINGTVVSSEGVLRKLSRIDGLQSVDQGFALGSAALDTSTDDAASPPRRSHAGEPSLWPWRVRDLGRSHSADGLLGRDYSVGYETKIDQGRGVAITKVGRLCGGCRIFNHNHFEPLLQ